MQCLVKLAFVWSFPPARGCRKTPPGALVAPLPDAEYLPFDEISLKLDCGVICNDTLKLKGLNGLVPIRQGWPTPVR